MATETVEVLVEGGKATAAPPIGPTLAPLKINVGQVVSDINAKTSDFKGMKVPVKIIVDKDTKKYEITVGTPPVSQLVKKELGIDKGSGQANKLKVGNLAIEQAIKIAKMKSDSIFGNGLKSSVKCIIGSMTSMGILVEGKEPKALGIDVNNGVYDNEINSMKTEVAAEKKELLKQQLEIVQEVYKKELERLKAEEEAAKAVAAAVAPEPGKEEAPEGKEGPKKKEEIKKEDIKTKDESKKGPEEKSKKGSKEEKKDEKKK